MSPYSLPYCLTDNNLRYIALLLRLRPEEDSNSEKEIPIIPSNESRPYIVACKKVYYFKVLNGLAFLVKISLVKLTSYINPL